MAAAVVVNATVAPGMLGSMRALLIVGMYAVVFSALVTGLSFAWVFYRESLRRARSEQELEMARRIQRSFLITRFPESPRLEIHALNRSSREVSGDFYDVVPSGDTSFLVAVADVSGKGVPAALLTSMLQASLRTQAAGAAPVGAILANVNELVLGTAPAQQFATFFLARVDESRLTLEYANAGHNPPVLVRRDGTLRLLETGGTVVGFLPGVTYEQETLALVPGDRLVVYSDGVTEAEGADREQYGEERLHALLAGLPEALNARALIERVLEDVDRHLGGLDAGDDITLLVLRVTEAAHRA
jgi:sigma-B regulation protein RsbU (phosphoserine phosphatase)